ncbi:ribonuclease P 40kDa subunit-domain-containing protein [Gongronella butleri]|nr:ribonuclease P 40kDa subunit-domain-containing protein [Gongronella butleri]
MSVYQTEPAPPSYCDLACYDYEQHEEQWRKTVDNHPFNKKLTIFLPFCTSEEARDLFAHAPAPVYYNVKAPCAKLLQDALFKKYIHASAPYYLLVHSIHTNLDTDVVVTLDHRRHLVISMGKQAYETFGIVGQRIKNQDRFVIDVDLSSSKTGPGNKTYDRLLWCLDHNMAEPMQWRVAAVDKVTGETAQIDFPEELGAEEATCTLQVGTTDNISLPVFGSLQQQEEADGQLLATAQWEHDVLAAMEWLGLLYLSADRAQSAASNAFVSTYQPPAPVLDNALGTAVSWTGLVPPTFVRQCLITARKRMLQSPDQPWVAVSVWGERDSPVTWTSHIRRGENDYTFLMMPPQGTRQRVVAYKMLGSSHSHS